MKTLKNKNKILTSGRLCGTESSKALLASILFKKQEKKCKKIYLIESERYCT